MKFSNKLYTSVLIASLAAMTFAPAALAATEPTPPVPARTADGKINFTAEDPDIDPPVTPPGTKDPEIDEPTINPDRSPLRIVSVTDIDFDTHAITSNESVERIYPAKIFETTKKGTQEKITMPHFIRFQDKRTTGEENHYQIAAKITKNFTNGTTVLTGATIDYNNIELMTSSNVSTMPTQDVLQGAGHVEVNSTDITPVLINKQAGKGYGVFELAFGTDKGATPNADKSINLKVPGSTVLKTGDYVGEVTWSITDAK